MGWDVCYCRNRTSEIVFTSAAGPLTLKVLSATRISRIPKLFSTFIKNQIWICWCGEPNATSNFIFKLIGRPTCITEGNEALLWTSVVTDVPQYLAR